MTAATTPLSEARQQLNEIIREDFAFEQKSREALELGRQSLGVDHGLIARIDEPTDHWEAVITTDTVSKGFSSEAERDLMQVYDTEAIDKNTIHTLHEAPDQGWSDTNSFEEGNFPTYLCVPLVIDEELYGMVCFIAENPQSEPFSDAEKWFAEHLAGLLERELEQERVEAQLASQTSLATVLNRVLRHNIRNDISVIRGYTKAMADQIDDDSFVDTTISHIDNLVGLSEKARNLEEVVSGSSKRQHVEIATLIEDIVEPLAKENPTASISVEYDEEIETDVLQNFDRAIEELVNNAIKHSGDAPTVTIVIESVPDGVEIRIQDDGPGLPGEEIEVLSKGEETPLAHGSGLGLWLAHWIISSHDGSIEPVVTSDGTTLVITLPHKTAVSVNQHLTELTRSHDKYKASFEQARDSILLFNDDGRIIDANSSAGDSFGVDEQELLGRHITEFLPETFDFETEWKEAVQGDREAGTATIRDDDGIERVFEYSASGDIIPGQHLFISRDITERKERERELASLKERYETLLDAAPDPVFVADAETEELLEVNEAAESLLGKSHDKLVGNHLTTLHPPEDAELYREAFQQIGDEKTTIRTIPDGSRPELVTDTGETVPIEMSVDTVSLPEQSVVFGIFRDISERVEREAELRAKTRAMDKAPVGITLTDPDQDDNPMSYTNEKFCELSGYEENEILGRNCRFMQGEETAPETTAAIRQAIENEESVRKTILNYRKDGTPFWNRLIIAPITDDTGEVVNWVGFQEDVTHQIAREQELEETTQQLEAVIQASPDAIIAATADGTIRLWNEAAEDLFGYEAAAVMGKPIQSLELHSEDEFTQLFNRAVEGEELTNHEIQYETKDGNSVQLSLSTAPITDEAGAIMGIMEIAKQ